MHRFFCLLGGLVLPVVCILIFSLHQPWQLVFIGMVHVAVYILWSTFRRKKWRLPDEYRIEQSKSRQNSQSFAWGMVWGMTTVMFAGCLLVAAQKSPEFAWLYDDRREHETESLANLVSNGNYEDAIKLIEQLLAEEISDDWKSTLRSERIRLLERWALASSHPRDESLLERAVALALADGIDTTTLILRLETLQLRRMTASQTRLTQEQALSIARAEQDVAAQRDRLAKLEREAAEKDDGFKRTYAEVMNACALKLRDTLIRWGDALSDDPEEQLPVYEEAAQTETRFRLASSIDLAAKLRTTRQRLAAMSPRALPTDLKLSVLQTHLDRRPFVEIDLKIESKGNAHYSGVTAQDMIVAAAGKRIRPIFMAEYHGAADKQHALVLVDVSGSMTGPPIESVKLGLRQLVENLPPQTQIRLVSFATTVNVICDWTTDRTVIAAGIGRLKADGATMLNRAIVEALQSLAKLDGPKNVLLFTDGRDSGGGRETPTTLRMATQTRVPIHTVAYAQGDIDRVFLSQLAAASGGTFSPIAEVERLSESLAESAERMTPRFYRLVFAANQRSSITIAVGKERSPSLTLELNEDRRTATRP